jgi:FkbM family methyltransferase
MKKTIDFIFKKLLPGSVYKKVLFNFRKARFTIKSFLFLPPYVYYGGAKISTRGWQTACVEFYKKSENWDIYEPETTFCFEEIIDRGIGCFWDIGAHIGYFSILASQKGIKTYAFEMDEDFIKEMKKHKDNNNLDIIIIDKPMAQNGQVINFENYGGLSVKTAISADNFLIKTENAVPGLIKVDIDGTELDFLAGAQKLLTEKSPDIIMELSKSRRKKIISKMREYGYKIVRELDYYTAHNALFRKIKND